MADSCGVALQGTGFIEGATVFASECVAIGIAPMSFLAPMSVGGLCWWVG